MAICSERRRPCLHILDAGMILGAFFGGKKCLICRQIRYTYNFKFISISTLMLRGRREAEPMYTSADCGRRSMLKINGCIQTQSNH